MRLIHRRPCAQMLKRKCQCLDFEQAKFFVTNQRLAKFKGTYPQTWTQFPWTTIQACLRSAHGGRPGFRG
jgi:hypothetical protein